MSTEPSSRTPRTDYPAEGAGSSHASQRPAKAPRMRLACLRCQTRKIKCDGSIPKCSGCRRAGAQCIDGKKTNQEGSISRSEAAALHSHIQRLEEVVRSHCPGLNLDLVAGGGDLPPPPGEEEASTNDNGFPPASHTRNGEAVSSGDEAFRNNLREHPTGRSSPQRGQSRNEIAHEIGLIPLSAGINKYVGPSSGLSFAKLVFARADHNSHMPGILKNNTTQESPLTTSSRSMFMIEPASIPTSIEQAVQLSKIYFEHVHIQYPFLHENSFFRLLHDLYSNPTNTCRVAWFQVTMVLAISASILSKRLRIPFTGEGLCASAMQYVEEVDFQNSTEGVQCLLLVSMFTLHSPFLRVNPWYLNYQCLAAVLDLGLQRDVPISPSIGPLEREMRTRIFWVIYSIDRTLATTLGRPIGLRDEACDLRLPCGHEDFNLDDNSPEESQPQPPLAPAGSMSCGIMLFQLAQMNSEIKYVLHSVTRNTPRYTYPQIPDIDMWQTDIWERLETLHTQIPVFKNEGRYMTIICQIRYNEVAMHLFRPTPRIRTPSKVSLIRCHESAETTILLWKELYESDRMSYSWITIHSVCLSALTMLYCIWTVPEIAASIQLDSLTSTMRDSSNLLSAAGEHWPEARRGRNSLDGLAAATVRWLLDTHANQKSQQPQQQQQMQDLRRQQTGTRFGNRRGRQQNQSQAQTEVEQGTAVYTMTSQQQYSGGGGEQLQEFNSGFEGAGIDTYINSGDLAVFVGAPDPFASDLSLTMDGMFSEYQPLFEFNATTDFGRAFFSDA